MYMHRDEISQGLFTDTHMQGLDYDLHNKQLLSQFSSLIK